jgi:FkbM family methyltransferase
MREFWILAGKAVLIRRLPRKDRGELMSWHARLLAGYLKARSRRVPPREIVGPTLFGVPLRAGSYRDLAFLVQEIFLQGTYDVGPLPAEPVIVDCGANIGIATLFFAHHYPGCRVTAFEPDPKAFAMLAYNTSGLDDVTVHNVALGREKGTIRFYVEPDMPGSLRMSGIKERKGNGQTITVDCVPLSSFLPVDVDLLKIDVEGMEWEILDDLEASGAIAGVQRLAIEYHHHLPAERDDLASFLERLESAGFGYEIGASKPPGRLGGFYQDVMIYAYRKEGARS